MTTWGRETPWRQGHVLSDQAANVLGLIVDGQNDQVVVVISHDCDLAQDPSNEPMVEVIVGNKIASVDGNFSYAKNARRLHLTFSEGSKELSVNMEANRKIQVSKHQLASYKPIDDINLNPHERNIFQRWLAARYRRSAFPDEFDRRLDSTGVRTRIGKVLKSHGSMISAIYFDVDQGKELSHMGSDDPYELVIYLLYSTENDPDAAEQAAESAKQLIITAFREKCISKDKDIWHDIELVNCEIISDQAMTVQQAESFKRWSVDHLSLRNQSEEAILHDK